MVYAKELAPNLFNTFHDWHQNYVNDIGEEPTKEATKPAVLYFHGACYGGINKMTNEQIDYVMEQIRNLTPKQPRLNATDLVDAATYGYRYVQQDQGSAFHKACELSKKLKKYDCSGGLAYYNYKYDPSFLTKNLNISEYKGEMNMKNVSIEEKQTLRVIRECNEWRDVYTIADTEPTDLFTLCGDQNMRVYMRVAMDEDTFLIKDPNMRPVLDVKTGCIEMMDKDEKIFIYDPRGCNLDVGTFMVKKPHEDRY